MSTEYYLRDPELDKKYDAFNQQLSAIKEQVLQMFSEIKVDEDLAWCKEDLLEAAKENALFEGYQHDYEKFIIGKSTVMRFYWRHDNGFTDLASLQTFLKQNPHLVITDEYHQSISFEAFQSVVSSTKKSQLSFDTEKSLNAQINDAKARSSANLFTGNSKDIEPVFKME